MDPWNAQDVTDLELRRLDPAANCYRLWGVTVTSTLWEPHALVIAWGRIGSKLRVRTETFASPELRTRRLRALLAVRARHGYTGASCPRP